MRNYLLAILMMVPSVFFAQDDDMYFVPEKPTSKANSNSTEHNASIKYEPIVDYGYNSRDADEYNRMSEYNDTVNDDSDAVYDSEDDYIYSRRLVRFRGPHVGFAVSSPFYWDLVYTYGAYDYWADPYYDPFYWDYGWRYGWSWGPWHSWHGPIWGWHSPHHWYHWGFGPGWGHGFHGHAVPYKHYARGTFSNRFNAGERIRTGAQASRSFSFERVGDEPQSRVRTSQRNGREDGVYTRYQRTRTGEGSNYRGSSSRSQRSSDYTRPSSSRYNSSDNKATDRQNVNSSRSSSRSSSYSRSSSSSSRSSFSSGGSSRSSFGGGGSRGGGGGSRGGRR